MSSGITIHHIHGYQVETDIYAGPLDLLLSLIEKTELDITKLTLASITDQYLEHIRSLALISPEEVSAFLVIASRLIQIKSEVLLPRYSEQHEDEEDDGDALIQQLIRYRMYKQAAQVLFDREQSGYKTYVRISTTHKIEPRPDLSDIDLSELAMLAQALFTVQDDRSNLGEVITPPKVTIREKIKLIINNLKINGHSRFSILVSSVTTRIDIVITFLALLELIKRSTIEVNQSGLFSEIEIQTVNAADDYDQIELEFGE
jgi:segregation and condensation protein A